MSTEILSQYIDELLAGRERPLQEYLLNNPTQRAELVPLLVGALAVHRSVESIDLLRAREEASRQRSLEELAKVYAEREDLTATGALSKFVQHIKNILGGGRH